MFRRLSVLPAPHPSNEVPKPHERRVAVAGIVVVAGDTGGMNRSRVDRHFVVLGEEISTRASSVKGKPRTSAYFIHLVFEFEGVWWCTRDQI